MQAWKLPAWVVIGLCIFCATPTLAYEEEPEGPGRSETPSSYNALVYEVYQFDIGSRSQAEDALTHQGYNVTWYGNPIVPDSTISPDPMLLDWRDEQDDGDGAMGFVGHGGNDGKGIEIWCHNDWGLQKCYTMKQYYETYHGFSGKLYVAEPSSNSGYSVSIRWGSIPQYCSYADAIIDIETCCSVLSSTYPGARVEFVNDCGLPYSYITTNMDAIWGGFDGTASGTEDDWYYRTAKWGFTLASSKLHMREPVTNGGFTTLAPYIKWASFQSNDQVPEEVELKILTDTKVQTAGSVLNAFEIYRVSGDPTIEIVNAVQDNDTTFTVTVRPVDGEFGTSYFKALHTEIVSANNSSAQLDGDGEEGPNDRVWRLKHGQDPAADIGAFTVDQNGISRVDIECLYQTQKLEIWGLEGDQHTTVATIENPQIGHTELFVGNSYPLYQLVEIETNGRIMDHGVVSPRERVYRDPTPHFSADEIHAKLDSLFATRGESNGGYRSSIPGNRLDILAAPQFLTTAEYHAYHRAWYDGIETVVIDVSQFGTTPEAIESGIQSYISSSPSQLFLLVGDGHSRLWTNQGLWSENGWDQIKQDYLAAGYPSEGNPENQDIPVGEVPDPAARNYNMGYFEPNWYKGDGPHYCQSDCPPKVVSRLPFHYDWQYANHLYKIYYYDNGPVGTYPYDALICVGDVDLYFGDGSGDYARDVADRIVSTLAPGTSYEPLLLQSVYMGAWQRLMETINRWQQDVDLVYFTSSRSTRYNTGHFLSLSAGFDISMLYGSKPNWMIGVVCDAGDEFRTMNPNPEYGETVLARLLQDGDCGAIGTIVAGSGTWQSGNELIAPEFNEKLFEDLSRPVMESFRQAQCSVLSALDPVDDYDAYNTVLSYFMYGDPCLLLRHPTYACDVPETPMPEYRLELRQNSPNPMHNNGTTIRFGLAETGPVQILVYDVGGRLVRTLVNGELAPGNYNVNWRGNTDDGRIASAGVYFCQMTAGGQKFNRKMILLD